MRTNLSVPILKIIHTLQGTKTAKPTKPAASDLPVPAEGVRNIKSMWEKGNVFSPPAASGTPNKVSIGFLLFNFGGWIFFSFFLGIIPVNNKSSEDGIMLAFLCNECHSKFRKNMFREARLHTMLWPQYSKSSA